jgi:preprotein translocase subunit SecG
MRVKIFEKIFKKLRELPIKVCENFLSAIIWAFVFVLLLTFLTLVYSSSFLNKEVEGKSQLKFEEKKFEELLKIFKEKGKIK